MLRRIGPLFRTKQARKWGEGLLFRSNDQMRFHPNRWASMDHAPGPTRAKAAPRVPKKMQFHGSAGCIRALKDARVAKMVPATGVHRPTSKSIPTMPASAFSTVG